MTKKDFIKNYGKKIDLTNIEASTFVDAFLAVAEEILETGEAIQFVGWGTFEVKESAERQGRNPKTGEAITIKAKKSVKFKAGKSLADRVNL